MLINWNGYTYEVCHDGERYVAVDRTRGRDKRRLNYNVWRNIHDGSAINPELSEALEGAVSQLESQHAPRKFAPTAGKAIGQPVHSGRPARRVTPREKRGNGRAE